jgi:anaphase-promoting complex subunit 8
MYPTQSTPALHWDQSHTSDLSGRFHDMGASPSARPYTDPTDGSISQEKRASTSSNSAHVRFAPSNDVSLLSIDDSGFKHGGGLQYQESWFEEDEDSYLLAKSLFDHHQWERCEALLEKRKVQGPKALFLKLYARYLILERRSEEE